MKKQPVYRSDITGLSAACRAAMMAIETAGRPIILANVYAALEQVIGLASSMEPIYGAMEVPDRYSNECGIAGMINGHVETDPVVLLPSFDWKMALVLVNVDDLMVPLSMAASWRHPWLDSLMMEKIDSVIFAEAGAADRWTLSRKESYNGGEIAALFGKVAMARARQDRVMIVLRMEKLG